MGKKFIECETSEIFNVDVGNEIFIDGKYYLLKVKKENITIITVMCDSDSNVLDYILTEKCGGPRESCSDVPIGMLYFLN
jgi:hypothetical protein